MTPKATTLLFAPTGQYVDARIVERSNNRKSRVIGSKNNKRKNAPKSQAATLPAGVKVIPAPKSAARRKLLSGPDIQTSGGRRTVHSHPVGPNRAKLLQGSGSQVRSIGVQGASILARPEVARLIDEAIAHNPVPFASAAASAT